MTQQTVLQDPPRHSASQRRVVLRSRGHRHGPITRLMSPGDLGEMVKPFVFLDLFDADIVRGAGFPPHPHSGIATVTVFLEGGMSYADTTGKTGQLSPGSVEWMRAGEGVWHRGAPEQERPMRGYQLWIALPPELELAPAESRYLEAEQIPHERPVRVILGAYSGMVSPITLPMPITYLHVQLEHGERWVYRPQPDHQVAWLALNSGRLRGSGTVLEREMVVFAEGNDPIELEAERAVEFVIGSAAKHAYPLVCGQYSIHTSSARLAVGENNIAALECGPLVAALREMR